MAGNWIKLTVKGKNSELEDISSIMSMLDNGLMIEDYSDFSLSGMYGELVDEQILTADKSAVKVSIFLSPDRSLAEYRSFLNERFGAIGISPEISVEGINEEDWAESWKKYYKPVPLGKITIVPRWESYTAKEGEIIVKMDPGMAFGTGTHETTRLVIRQLQKYIHGGEKLLDVGTGSGILSICASKLGAALSNAYDIDPMAVEVARKNIADEGIENIKVGISDLLRDVDRTVGKYDICVANIVADIIVRMLPDLGELITDNAPVILSGIIAPSKDKVIECATECGYKVIDSDTENDWVALVIKKDSSKK